MINKCYFKYLQFSLSFFLEMQVWTAVVEKLPKLSAWPGISPFLCTGDSQRGGCQPSWDLLCCAEVLKQLDPASQPSQEKAVGVSHALETFSNQYHFVTSWSTSFIHTLAFLAMPEGSRAKGQQLQGTSSQVCPERFVPSFVNSRHNLLNVGFGLHCQGWKADELSY